MGSCSLQQEFTKHRVNPWVIWGGDTGSRRLWTVQFKRSHEVARDCLRRKDSLEISEWDGLWHPRSGMKGSFRWGREAPWGWGSPETWCSWLCYEANQKESRLQISGSHRWQPQCRASSNGPHTWAAGFCESPGQFPHESWLIKYRFIKLI